MFWTVYNKIAVLALLSQFVFILQMIKNYRYALHKSKLKESYYHPITLLTVPCKGLDKTFEKNISSFYNLDYENYYLNFVVEDESDPAYEPLCKLKDKLAADSKALNVNILIAGIGSECSQKIHNLLHSTANAPADTEVYAFADSDACIRPDWLRCIVHPLRKEKYGATTGYRWFVPERNNLASLVLSALNGKIAQMMGNISFNQAWGGSMAIRTETFKKIKLQEVWKGAISDDLCLSNLVKKAGLKICFVPACLVASYEETTWPKLFEFARRQFLITRISTPGAWWFALFSVTFAVAGLWLGGLIAICAWLTHQPKGMLYIAVPALFFVGQLIRSILRQKMAVKLLPEDAQRMKPVAYADIFGNAIWAWIMLAVVISSAFGRTIKWRGIRYKLISATKTQKLG